MPEPTRTPTTPATPAQIIDQLGSLITMIAALRTSAAGSGVPQAVLIGLDWLHDDAITVQADARAAQARVPA